MKVLDIITTIEKTAPLAAAAAWDASGVQVASRLESAFAVAVMLDPTPGSIRAALDAGADFILSHHPLSMKPRFPDKADSYLDILGLLFKKDAWLYSAHTSLDGNPEGPVRWLARELALENARLLETEDRAGADVDSYGFGFVGDLPLALPYDEFCARLRQLAGVSAWNACGAVPETVRRVACCPGSGSDLIGLAAKNGADVFITGDVKYHAALDASGLLPRILDVGHFSLEEEMMRRFAAQLDKELSVPVVFYPAQDPLRKE
jgi:dinuclear metal center YbgI/SA1388 family protein